MRRDVIANQAPAAAYSRERFCCSHSSALVRPALAALSKLDQGEPTPVHGSESTAPPAVDGAVPLLESNDEGVRSDWERLRAMEPALVPASAKLRSDRSSVEGTGGDRPEAEPTCRSCKDTAAP